MPAHYESLTHQKLATSEPERQAAVEAHQADLQGYLRSLQGGTFTKVSREVHRRKAYLWLVSLELQLLALTSRRLCYWLPEAGSSPSSWPCLTLCSDQDPNARCALNWLLHKGYNVAVVADPSHRIWNDCKGALAETRLWSVIVAATCVVNWETGPWQERSHYDAVVDMLGDLDSLLDHDDAVLPYFSSAIIDDNGWQHRRGDQDLDLDIKAAVAQAWRRKMPRTGLCRWFEICDGLSELKKHWHAKLVTLVHLAGMKGAPSLTKMSTK